MLSQIYHQSGDNAVISEADIAVVDAAVEVDMARETTTAIVRHRLRTSHFPISSLRHYCSIVYRLFFSIVASADCDNPLFFRPLAICLPINV